jgi:lysophospholipase L1-like esterase
MKLLAVGDSFTYGEELSDLNNAWPYLLGNKLGYTVNNLAKPGSGNTRMVRHAVEQINNYDLIVIAWSHFARTELADENGFYDIWPECSILPHKEFSSWRSDVINYYSKHHDDDYLYRQYLINIILLQQYLKNNNKKYLMLDAFGNHQNVGRRSNDNNNLIKQIDKDSFLGWPDQSMMEWTNGTPQGLNGHFLEQGHKQVADKIYEHIRHFGWIS